MFRICLVFGNLSLGMLINVMLIKNMYSPLLFGDISLKAMTSSGELSKAKFTKDAFLTSLTKSLLSR